MFPLTPRDLLHVWERGEGKHPVDQALLILTAACPEKSWEELAQLSIGQRDALILMVRELTFGTELSAFTHCPQCQDPLTFTVDVADLLAAGAPEPAETELTCQADGLTIKARLPNSLDVAAIVNCDRPEAARSRLLKRCVLEARQGDRVILAQDLPEAAISSLAAEMVECDPLSEMAFNLCCPECDCRWSVILDVVSFFWSEIAAQGRRLLRDVHDLARAYGWREADILAMSTQRRQFYLQMVD